MVDLGSTKTHPDTAELQARAEMPPRCVPGMSSIAAAFDAGGWRRPPPHLRRRAKCKRPASARVGALPARGEQRCPNPERKNGRLARPLPAAQLRPAGPRAAPSPRPCGSGEATGTPSPGAPFEEILHGSARRGTATRCQAAGAVPRCRGHRVPPGPAPAEGAAAPRAGGIVGLAYSVMGNSAPSRRNSGIRSSGAGTSWHWPAARACPVQAQRQSAPRGR